MSDNTPAIYFNELVNLVIVALFCMSHTWCAQRAETGDEPPYSSLVQNDPPQSPHLSKMTPINLLTCPKLCAPICPNPLKSAEIPLKSPGIASYRATLSSQKIIIQPMSYHDTSSALSSRRDRCNWIPSQSFYPGRRKRPFLLSGLRPTLSYPHQQHGGRRCLCEALRESDDVSSSWVVSQLLRKPKKHK